MISTRSALNRRRWLFVFGRNFGDAVIGRSLYRKAVAAFPEDEFQIVLRPQFLELFSGSRCDKSWLCQFPMGTRKGMSAGELFRTVRVIVGIRNERMSCVVNDFGDVRECLFGWLCRPKFNVAPVWPTNHPFRRMIRDKGARGFVNWPIEIPENLLSVYAVRDYMAEQLGFANIPQESSSGRRVRTVGLHPFASQECRLWPWDRWRELVAMLHTQGIRIRIFGASNERDALELHFSKELARGSVELLTGTLSRFLEGLGELGVLVSLDSFSVHAAYAEQVPVVMVNGANDYRLWAPPGSVVLANGGGCEVFPCYCKPNCVGGTREYVCIRGIPTATVFAAVMELLRE